MSSPPDLERQRSVLLILIAACSTAQKVFDEAGDAVGADLRADLARIIERSQRELQRLTAADENEAL